MSGTETNHPQSENVVQPLLFQLNVRRFLQDMKREHSLPTLPTLKEIPDDFIDELCTLGFDTLYLLGVWQTGEEGIIMSRKKFHESQVGICSSPFAVTEYKVHTDFGGESALLHLKERLKARNVKIILDFVPNHVARDHVWVNTKPEMLMQGTEELLQSQPNNFYKNDNGIIFAHGRDPYFDGWSDTIQINYFNAEVRKELIDILCYIASLCDGIRVDMAMLICTEIFNNTWGFCGEKLEEQFWVGAIEKVKSKFPKFTFMAEVYWDYEFELQTQGFDYTYDKRLYDRLHTESDVPGHLNARYDYQAKSVRFLENHDEERAAFTFYDFDKHRAAAVISYTIPGLKFFHEGQLEGRRNHLSMHLYRRIPEVVDENILSFFYRFFHNFLKYPHIRAGRVIRVTPGQATFANEHHRNIVAHYITCANETNTKDDLYLVVVNYSSHFSEGYISAPSLSSPAHLQMPLSVTPSISTTSNLLTNSCDSSDYIFMDLLSSDVYKRNFNHNGNGVYFGLSRYQSHIFRILPC